MSDIALAEQWLKETSAAIRTLCKQLGVDSISLDGDICFIHAHDEKGKYILCQLASSGYVGLFSQERRYCKDDESTREDV